MRAQGCSRGQPTAAWPWLPPLRCFVQNGIAGTTGPEMWFSEVSGNKGFAFKNELGIQSPMGFYNSMGFTLGGDVKDSVPPLRGVQARPCLLDSLRGRRGPGDP